MKKLLLIVVLLILSLLLDGFISSLFMHKEIISELPGKIFFLRRDNQVLNLYSADAKLHKVRLVYSNLDNGEKNANIIDYYYDKSGNAVFFIAMQDGEWSLHSIKPGDKESHYIKRTHSLDKYIAYIKPDTQGVKAVNKKGSLYLQKEGKETLLKRYYGFYDQKFAPGYVPLGFSPDGRYLIYSWTGHFTPLGAMLEIFILPGKSGSLYVIDTCNGKSAKYLRGQKIQWLMVD